VSPSALPYLALALGILSLGFSGILVRWAQAPGIITSFYRMLLAGVLLGIPFLRQARAAGGLSRRGIWVAALGGAFFAADVATWSTGVMLGGATNPTLLANVAPVWVALAAVLLLKERLGGRFWMGLALAFAGAGLVLRVDLTRGAAFGQGSALGLLASVFYGGYLFVTQLGRRDLELRAKLFRVDRFRAPIRWLHLRAHPLPASPDERVPTTLPAAARVPAASRRKWRTDPTRPAPAWRAAPRRRARGPFL